MQRYFKILLAAVASVFFTCAPIDVQAADKKLRVIFITHGQAGDPYWNAIKNGLAEAAKTLQCRCPV